MEILVQILMEPGTVLITLILVAGGLIFYSLKLKSLHELARIDHGLTAMPKDRNRLKKMGIIAISIGIGMLFGYFIGKWAGLPYVVAIPSMILIIGGAALIMINQMKG